MTEQGATSKIVRVAAVQFEMQTLTDVETFYARINEFTRIAADYGCAFVTFPEWFTLPLLSIGERLSPAEAMRTLVEHLPDFKARLSKMAKRHDITIIGGSTAEQTDAGLYNTSFIFLPDGRIHRQPKIHPTPDERAVWNIVGASELLTFDTEHCPIAVQICYDSEFPELARKQADDGARILFVPYATDARTGHLRVRYCSQARTVENQIFVVTAGNVGRVSGVENIDINYARSAVMTPSDHPFARDGIAAEATENIEQIFFADLDLGLLDWARTKGAARNFEDRRSDLYRVDWRSD